MQNSEQVAVIDIGSSKISAFVGERGVNGTFIIKGYNEQAYSGFLSGEFLDKAETEEVLRKLVLTVKQGKTPVKTVYIGVPAGFTKNIVRDAQISFNKKRKITDKEIDELYAMGFSGDSTGYSVINRSPIFFELDDFRKTPDAVGEVSVSLKGRVSYVLCGDSFVSFFRSVLRSEGFNECEFVSVALAEALYLVSPESRDRIALIADVGYITSTVTVIQGDGILYQRSFDMGGGMITAALTEAFNVPFDIAEKVKRKASLSIDAKDGDVYEIVSGDDVMYFNINKVKRIVNANLDKLAEEIDASFKKTRMEFPEYLPLLLTGGGITYLRGAKERLSSRLNMNVEVIYPDLPLYDKPINSSMLSVLNLALENN